ncbi:MAG TPA: hypothetical protein VGH93_12185, partial [Solirubrobacteraceae bacterium]
REQAVADFFRRPFVADTCMVIAAAILDYVPTRSAGGFATGAATSPATARRSTTHIAGSNTSRPRSLWVSL